MPAPTRSGSVLLKAELTWHGNHLCQSCGATLDRRTPDLVELLDVQPRPMYFIPICKDCYEQTDTMPQHPPLASSMPPKNYGNKARYNE